MSDFLSSEQISKKCNMFLKMRTMIPPNFVNIKAPLAQTWYVFGDAKESSGHAQAQSLQNLVNFARSDVCAIFHEFSSTLSPSKMCSRCGKNNNLYKNNRFLALLVPWTREHFRAWALITDRNDGNNYKSETKVLLNWNESLIVS